MVFGVFFPFLFFVTRKRLATLHPGRQPGQTFPFFLILWRRGNETLDRCGRYIFARLCAGNVAEKMKNSSLMENVMNDDVTSNLLVFVFRKETGATIYLK
jgi:hypothetical protein